MKILVYSLSFLLVLTIAAVAFLMLALPNVGPPPAITVDHSEQQVLRGKYLAWHALQCVECHSERDFGRYAGPIKPGTEMAGGERFDQSMGLPGAYISPNITPAGIGD